MFSILALHGPVGTRSIDLLQKHDIAERDFKTGYTSRCVENDSRPGAMISYRRSPAGIARDGVRYQLDPNDAAFVVRRQGTFAGRDFLPHGQAESIHYTRITWADASALGVKPHNKPKTD